MAINTRRDDSDPALVGPAPVMQRLAVILLAVAIVALVVWGMIGRNAHTVAAGGRYDAGGIWERR